MRKALLTVSAVTVGALASLPAWCQETGFDYAAGATTIRTELNTMLGDVWPIALGIGAIFMAIRYVPRLVKSVVK